MRRAVSPQENAELIASFVMGAEFLLILFYVRIQILAALKGVVENAAKAELNRPGSYIGDDPPAEPRVDLGSVYSMLTLDGEHRTGLLVCLVYGLTALFFIGGISRMRGRGEGVSVPTLLTSVLAGLAVFALSQWGYLKFVILPHYARLFNTVSGSSIPVIEMDDARTTAALLSPTLIAAVLFVAYSVVYFGAVDWRVVGVTTFIAALSVSTEVVSWVAVTGYSVSMESVVSAVADAATAVLWVTRDNSPTVALEKLHDALFPDASSVLSLGNIAPHFYMEFFARRRLEVAFDGSLVVVKAPTPLLRSLCLVGCSLALMIAPVVAVAVWGRGLDFVVLLGQIAAIGFVYAMFIRFSDTSNTMKRIIGNYRKTIKQI
jgi:hypothetical protein